MPKKKSIGAAIQRDKYLFLMFIPAAIYYIVFHYIPLSGVVIAFKNFQPGNGIYAGEWVGLKWFQEFFHSIFAGRLIRNTVLLSLYSLIFGFPLPIIFAVCVSEIKWMKPRRIIQTVSYIPYFISTVVRVGMIKNFFSLNDGIVNQIIEALGGKRINFMMSADWFRPLYVGSGIWKSFGFDSIIYIAAIAGVDPSLYEAAKLDGITKFKEVYHITLPSIAPTILMLFILSLGSIMSVGFEKVYLMYSPAVYETADVISTYVYRKGIESNSLSFATAIGLFNSVINFLFVYGANRLSRKATQTSLW